MWSPASPTGNASFKLRAGRLTPATRLVAAVTGAGLALAWDGWVAAAVVVVSGLVALAAGSVRRLALAALTLVPVALSSFLINALLPAGGGGVSAALGALLRLLAVTLPPTLLFSTTPVSDLLADLEAHGVGRRAVFVLGATLAAVPRTQVRASAVIEAQRSRGLDTEGSLLRRARGVLPLVAPLIIGSLAEVEDRTLALQVRAFGAPGRRTVLRPAVDSRLQRWARWVLAAVLVAGLVARLAVVR